MRLRFLTAALALFASITVLFTGFAAPQAGAAPTTASVAAIDPDHVPSYCLTSNPPPICWAFQGNADLNSKIDLGTFDGLVVGRGGLTDIIIDDAFNHPCFTSNPPRWCWLVSGDRSDVIDPDPTIYVPVGGLDRVIARGQLTDVFSTSRVLDTMINERAVAGHMFR